MQNTVITKVGDAQIAEILEITDLEELLLKIKQMAVLKKALESCDRFRENSIKFAMMEAAALVRVVQLGGVSNLRGYRRHAAEWLVTLSEEELQQKIQMCADGMTIDQVWKREVHSAQIFAGLKVRQDWLVEDIKTQGIVNIEPYSKEAYKKLPENEADAMVDNLRNVLRRAGAVGCSGGVYVMPTPNNEDKVKEAIALRFTSIAKDLAKIREIAEASTVTMGFGEIDPENRLKNQPELIHLFRAIDTYGFMTGLDYLENYCC